MLFIPFIENAFKHGKKSGNDKILIQLDYQNQELKFLCFNKKRELNETEKTGNHGIGMENIRRRLELIYAEKHTLLINETDAEFQVDLKIYLS
jgi:sensor histidine kinase YesM